MRIQKYDRKEEAIIKTQAKLRGLGYAPINAYQEGMDYHHLFLNNDNSIGIYIPTELHRSVSHDGVSGKNLRKINNIIFEWLTNQSTIIINKSKKSNGAINTEKIRKVGRFGDSKNSIINRALDSEYDIMRCLDGNEPRTENLINLKLKWQSNS